MADQASADPPAGEAHESQADTPGSPADAGDTISLDEARKLRREAATLRKREKDLVAELQQHREAGLSELEKAQRRIADLEAAQAQAVDERKARAVERLLAGAQYPDLLLSKVALADIELTDDGAVRQGDRLVARLRDAYPALWATGSADGGAHGAASSAFDMNAYIRRQARR